MLKLEITPAALADIEQIFLWWKGQPELASRANDWFTGISEAILSLETMPRRHPLAPEARTVGRESRQRLFGKDSTAYRILFVVYGDQTVTVLRVRHAARGALEASELGALPQTANAEDDQPQS